MGGAGAAALAASVACFGASSPASLWIGLPLAAYLAIGVRDMRQSRHTVLRNFPVRTLQAALFAPPLPLPLPA